MDVSELNADIPFSNTSELILNGEREYRQIAFTYDSGFDDNETTEILDVLKRHNVKATFFLTGIWVEKYSELAKRIHHEDHEIGNCHLQEQNELRLLEHLYLYRKLIYLVI